MKEPKKKTVKRNAKKKKGLKETSKTARKRFGSSRELMEALRKDTEKLNRDQSAFLFIVMLQMILEEKGMRKGLEEIIEKVKRKYPEG